jgi:uncharacterized protein
MTALATVTSIDGRRPAPEAHAPTEPALYEGVAVHRRHTDPKRVFAPKLFMTMLDVDALPESLDPLPGWSARRAAPVHFRTRDFLDGSREDLGDGVRDLVEACLGRRPTGPVSLLAHLRTFGWLFNPIAVYYCWSEAGDALDAVVLEVTSTPWGERSWYVADARNGKHTTIVAKAMHVSPFLPMDVEYRITWTTPGDRLRLRIDVVRAGTHIFDARLELHRVPLDRRNAVAMPLRHWLLPLRVSLGIYREAAKLWIRRARFFPHPKREQSRP